MRDGLSGSGRTSIRRRQGVPPDACIVSLNREPQALVTSLSPAASRSRHLIIYGCDFAMRATKMNRLVVVMITAVSLVFGLVIGAIKSLLTEEIRTRLRQLTYALIRLAGSRVVHEIRDDLFDEWRAELDYIFRDTEGLPVTALLHGTTYATGLLLAAPAIERELTGAKRSFHVHRGALSFIGLLCVILAIFRNATVLILGAIMAVGYLISLRRQPFSDSRRGGHQERLGVRLGLVSRRPRYISGSVKEYRVTGQRGVSFTIVGADRSLEVMMPDDAPEQLLGLHNGDVVRVILNEELTGIKGWGDFELLYYADGTKATRAASLKRKSN